MGTPSLLTLQQTADALQISMQTVRRVIGEGKLRALKVRGQWRIDTGDLNAYIASCRVYPPVDKPKKGRRRKDVVIFPVATHDMTFDEMVAEAEIRLGLAR